MVYAARILSKLMEGVGAFGSVLPLLLSRGLLQQLRVSNTGGGGSSRHGSDSTPNLRARQYCTPTSTRISHRHGDWRSWYARRLPPVHFPIERPQKRTGGSIHDRIGGAVLIASHIRPGGVMGYAPNRRGRTSAIQPAISPKMLSISHPKNPKHAGNEQL